MEMTTRRQRPEACPQGHMYTADNTYNRATGTRECRTCTRVAKRDDMRRSHAAAPEKRRERKRLQYAADPDRMLASIARWKRKNAERMDAVRTGRNAVTRAIRRGDLIRPTTCQECGVTGVAIEAAHIDYSRPLDVRWLCRPCHRRWDHEQPKSKARAS